MTAAKAEYVQIGKSIPVTVTADTAYHGVVPLGLNAIGIACASAEANTIVNVDLCGVWELPADNTNAISVGDKLYWDDTNQELTLSDGSGDNTPATNAFAGIAVEAMAVTGSKVKVKIG